MNEPNIPRFNVGQNKTQYLYNISLITGKYSLHPTIQGYLSKWDHTKSLYLTLGSMSLLKL